MIQPSTLNAQQIQLELIFREVVAVEVLHEGSGSNNVSAAVELVREALCTIQSEIDRNETVPGYQAPLYRCYNRKRQIRKRAEKLNIVNGELYYAPKDKQV